MLIISILTLLISNAVSSRRDKSILYSRVSITILICCLLLCMNSFYFKFHDKGLGLFGGLYHTTVITHTFQIFVFFITFLVIQLNCFYPRRLKTPLFGFVKNLFINSVIIKSNILNKMSQQYRIIEYPLIILFVVIGGVLLMSSSDLISIFLCIELQSYALYILCALYRDSERATSGALTYFLLGGLSSCFILLASGLLYANSGNTGFDGLYVINNISGVDGYSQGPIQRALSYLYNSNYINFSFTIMSIGFLFKISAAPFHFWSPDVYDSIPTIVTTFVAVFAKISILVLLLELIRYTSNLIISADAETISNNSYNLSWSFTLLISSLLSLIIGAVLGLTQSRIKRLYAYSTISHLGFILLALTINSIESIQSFIFYLIQYSISNLNAFIVLIAISYTLYIYVDKQKDNLEYSKKETSKTQNLSRKNKDELAIANQMSDKNNSPIQLITDIKGFFYINPVLAISLAITLFSFVGIPPLIGFFAKQMVLTSALDNGYVFMALIAIITSVISAFYYLVLVKQVFFDNADYQLNNELSFPSVKYSIRYPLLYKKLGFTAKNAAQWYIIKIRNKTITIIDSILTLKNIDPLYICLNSSIASTISVLTLITLLFMLAPQEWLNLTTILSLIMFNS